MSENVKLLNIFCTTLNTDAVREGTRLSVRDNFWQLVIESDFYNLISLDSIIRNVFRVKLSDTVLNRDLQAISLAIDPKSEFGGLWLYLKVTDANNTLKLRLIS